jgi:AraC-like DNA-binding protein
MQDWKSARFSVLLVRVLASEMRRRGLSERELLAGTGIDQALLADVWGTISAPTWGQLLERAVQISGDPALGLGIAEHWSQSKLQFLGQLFASCRTMRDVYAMFERYKPLLGSSIRWELVERGDRAYLFCDPVLYHLPATRIAFEAWLGALMAFGRSFLCVSGDRTEVWFKHAQPEYHAQYARVFDCSVRFSQPHYAIVSPREYLDREQVLSDATTLAALESGAEHLLIGARAKTTAERVRALLWFERDLAEVNATSIAKRLRLSDRALRRRLAVERVQLSHLLNDTRLRIARQALEKPGMSIKETAYALGFSEPSAFFRAFKRWGGQTPLEYLKELAPDTSSAALAAP